jgi:hypothetical protein
MNGALSAWTKMLEFQLQDTAGRSPASPRLSGEPIRSEG